MTWAFIATLVTVVCTLTSYKSVPFVSKVPWWRGLVSVRRAALLRAEYRGVNKTLEKTPVAKEVWKALRAARELGQFVKTGVPQILLADIVAVIGFVYIVLAFEYLIDSYLIWEQAGRVVGHIPDWWSKPKEFQWWTPIVGWSTGAILLYVAGLYCDQSLFFCAGTGFAFVPLVKYFSLDLHPLSGARLFVATGLTLASCSLLRWLFLRREQN